MNHTPARSPTPSDSTRKGTALAAPIDSHNRIVFGGGQQLVFRRSFIGVDKGPARTELAQPLGQALDLYWVDEQSAYCRLDEDGDIQPIIRLRPLSDQTGEAGAIIVTIEKEQLYRYMAATGTVLVTNFDFTRYIPESFDDWDDIERINVNKGDLSYHAGIKRRASFANGALIVRTPLTTEMLIAQANRRYDDAAKQYATFKAHDWKNDQLSEISCAPFALASYFAVKSSLPFQITPAFFKPDVLQKYKADTEKYKLDYRSIEARAG